MPLHRSNLLTSPKSYSWHLRPHLGSEVWNFGLYKLITIFRVFCRPPPPFGSQFFCQNRYAETPSLNWPTIEPKNLKVNYELWLEKLELKMDVWPSEWEKLAQPSESNLIKSFNNNLPDHCSIEWWITFNDFVVMMAMTKMMMFLGTAVGNVGVSLSVPPNHQLMSRRHHRKH